MANKNVIVSVTNDLATDIRVEKVCHFLLTLNYKITLVGRKLPNSLPVERPYAIKRFKLLFNKGPLFYAEYNLRLFFFLLFQPKSLLVANDLDTLLPNVLISKLKGSPLVYDSHEYYTGVPELEGRPAVQKVWKAIERFCMPKLRYCITVNKSIAGLYKQEYGKDFKVVRNVPEGNIEIIKKTRQELGLPEDKKIIILQGAGININRGAEELIESMQYLDGYFLLIIGGGDVFATLENIAIAHGVTHRIKLLGKMPRKDLLSYTAAADLGATLDKGTSTNYLYSLPNKVFDYVYAGIPVLSSDLPELRNVLTQYGVGVITPSHRPQDIAQTIQSLFNDAEAYHTMKANTVKAAAELNWENEKKVLVEVYSQLPN